MSTPAAAGTGTRTNEVHRAAGIHLRDLFAEDLGAVHGGACCRHTGCQNLHDTVTRRDHVRGPQMSDRRWEPGTVGMAHLYTISFERIADPSPVLDLQRRNGRAECDRVEAKESVTEHNWILGSDICRTKCGWSGCQNTYGCNVENMGVSMGSTDTYIFAGCALSQLLRSLLDPLRSAWGCGSLCLMTPHWRTSS